jgi:hypothetical protein
MSEKLTLTDTELLEVRKFAITSAIMVADSQSGIVAAAEIIEAYLIRDAD